MALEYHRIHTRNEWGDTPYEQLTLEQRVAARSGGVLTLANLVTLASGRERVVASRELAHAPERTKKENWRSVRKLARGYVGDFVDGWLAKRGGVRNWVGKYTDMTVDNGANLVAVPSLAQGKLLPKGYAATLFVLKSANVVAAALNRQPRDEQQASTIGTIGAGMLYTSMVVESAHGVHYHSVDSTAAEADEPPLLRAARTGLQAATVAVNAVATVGYIRDTARSWQRPAAQ